MQVRTRVDDFAAQRDGFFSWRAARLGFLPGRVDLHVDRDLGQRGLRGEEVAARGVEKSSLFEGIYRRYAEEVGNFGKGLAVTLLLLLY